VEDEEGGAARGAAVEGRMLGVSWKNRTMNPTRPMLAPPMLPDGAELVLRMLPLPADTNSNGDIFGGWLMAQVDLAGAVLPSRIARGRIATVAVNQFLFKQPVSVGDLLSFYARVERIGTTSVTVHVEVLAERNPADVQVVKVTEANLTYVAIDRDGKPRAIPRDA
jgi:acyl-CoA thioesterase YciA